jgi:hypothetical protein
LTAINVSEPRKPKTIYFGGSSVFTNHGMSFNANGTRVCLASFYPAGLAVVDVSEIQNRMASQPRIKQIAKINWKDGGITQKALPVVINKRPYLIAIDEFGGQSLGGGVRFIDISDKQNPVVVSHIRLAIQLKENADALKKHIARNGIVGYDAHYC